MRQAYLVTQQLWSSFPIGVIQLLEIVDVESVETKKSDHLIKLSNQSNKQKTRLKSCKVVQWIN